MRIHAFAQHYPSPYKPYYDAQFAELVDRGHELRVFAAGRLDRVTNEKVERYGLSRRTRLIPTVLRDIPGAAPRALWNAAMLGGAAPGRARRAAAAASGVKARLLAATGALLLGRPRPDLCLVHGLGTAALFPWLREIFPDVPVALYYHGGEVPLAPRLAPEAAARAFAIADIVFTNTDFSRFQAIGRGCPPERVSVLPVGFALEDYTPPPERVYRPDGRLRLLSAGRLSEEKGLSVALEALERVVARGERAVSYTIVGDGYLRPELEARVRDHGLLPYVRFTGVLPHAALIRELGAADALLLPSVPLGNWAETQACAVQEAMLMGALVVVTGAGGVPESVPPEMGRFVVPPGDPKALAAAILSLSNLGIDQMRRLAAAGRRFAVERYDIRHLNEELIERSRATRRRGSGGGARPLLVARPARR